VSVGARSGISRSCRAERDPLFRSDSRGRGRRIGCALQSCQTRAAKMMHEFEVAAGAQRKTDCILLAYEAVTTARGSSGMTMFRKILLVSAMLLAAVARPQEGYKPSPRDGHKSGIQDGRGIKALEVEFRKHFSQCKNSYVSRITTTRSPRTFGLDPALRSMCSGQTGSGMLNWNWEMEPVAMLVISRCLVRSFLLDR
jgi:hypothetical protein